jgi:hypothetical protein
MGFWTPPGASWAPGRPVEDALGGKGGVGKLYGGLLGPSWGSLGASWARFGSIFFPRGGGGEGHFEGFLGTSRPRGKNRAFFKYLNVFSALFLCYMLSFVAFLAAWPAAPRIYKKHEIPLVFVGRKPNVPFSRSARSKQISEGTRSKNRWKTSSNKEPTGPETKQQKTNIFEATCAEDGRQIKRAKRSLGRLRGGKTKRKPYLNVVGGDSCFSQRGSERVE